MGKVKKLDRIYEDIEKTYGQASEEEMKKAIENLQKEIDGKKSALGNLKEDEAEKKEQLEKNVETLEKRLENMKGYSKNRTQIAKIKEYKASLENKLSEQLKSKEKSDKDLKSSNAKLTDILKRLKDEKYTMSLDQHAYNDLQVEKERLEKEIKDLKDNKIAIDKRITDLRAKIGKCDLAWKTLFVNKDWDEIQRRAESDKVKYTRKVDEKNPPVKGDKAEKDKDHTTDETEIDPDVKGKLDQVFEEVDRENASKEKDDKTEENTDKEKESNLPATVTKWGKFKNFFIGLVTRPFRKENKNQKLKENSDKEQEPKQSTDKEQQPKETKRDAFLEGLRQYADEEYKNQVRNEKEERINEVHKIQNKQNRETRDEDGSELGE